MEGLVCTKDADNEAPEQVLLNRLRVRCSSISWSSSHNNVQEEPGPHLQRLRGDVRRGTAHHHHHLYGRRGL